MASNCSSYTLNGITLGCKDHMGGVKRIWLAEFDDVIIEFEYVAGDTDKKNPISIKSATMAEGKSFHKYDFRKGTANMVSTASSDDTVGTFAVASDLNLQFTKMESSKRLEIMAMCLNSMRGVVQDNNDRYWLIGADNAIGASAASGETGTALGDFGGYKVTLHDESRQFPFELSNEILVSLGIKNA